MNAAFHSGDGDVSAEVAISKDKPITWLTIKSIHGDEMVIFRDGPLALEKILDLGYEIVNACRKLMPQVQEHAPANEASEADVTHDFRPGAYAGPIVP